MSTPEYRAANRELLAQRQREYRARNFLAISARGKLWKRKRKPRKRAREYRRRKEAHRSAAYKERKKLWRREWRKRYLERPGPKLSKRLRDRLAKILRGRLKTGSAVALLGCAPAELVAHLERQFAPSMTWANWGPVWHVDHIRPLAGFDLTDPQELAAACHFTNLRPLAKAANLAKGAKAVYLI